MQLYEVSLRIKSKDINHTWKSFFVVAASSEDEAYRFAEQKAAKYFSETEMVERNHCLRIFCVESSDGSKWRVQLNEW